MGKRKRRRRSKGEEKVVQRTEKGVEMDMKKEVKKTMSRGAKMNKSKAMQEKRECCFCSKSAVGTPMTHCIAKGPVVVYPQPMGSIIINNNNGITNFPFPLTTPPV
jgi:hypothetical protein